MLELLASQIKAPVGDLVVLLLNEVPTNVLGKVTASSLVLGPLLSIWETRLEYLLPIPG